MHYPPLCLTRGLTNQWHVHGLMAASMQGADWECWLEYEVRRER
jgi:hypothetical protein